MRAQDLVKHKIYRNKLDVKVPLMFTGKIQDDGEALYALFTPVKTKTNKNWFDALPVVSKNFHPEFGNLYIEEAK